MKSFLLLFFLFCIINQHFANSKIDSLLHLLPQCADTNCVKIYEQIADEYYYEHDYKTSAGFYKKAFEEVKKLPNRDFSKLAFYSGQCGDVYMTMGYYTIANEYFITGLKFATLANDSFEIASNTSNLGINQFYLSNYEQSLQYFLKALEIDTKLNNRDNIAIDYNTIGKVYLTMEQYDLSLDFYKKAFDIDSIENNESKMAIRLNSIGEVYFNKEEFEKALQFFLRAYELDEKNGNTDKMAIRMNGMGRVYQKLGQYAQSQLMFFRALKIFDSLNLNRSRILTLQNIGNFFYEQKRYPKAIEYYLKANSVTDSIDLPAIKISNLKSLSQTYQQTGDFKKACHYYNLYDQLKDSIFQVDKQNLINEYQVRYESEKKDEEIGLLHKENLIKDLKLSQSRHFSILLLIIAMLFIIIAVLFYLRSRTRKKTNELLSDKNAKLDKLIATKNKFTALIAHDLKNPVAAFHTIAKSLKDNFSQLTPDEIRYFINELEGSSQSLKSLLSRLLDWARLQNEHVKLQKEPVDVKKSIESVLSITEPMQKLKSISVHSAINETPELNTNENALNTILTNLVSNAIKFSPRNSSIFIKTSTKNSSIVFSFEDQGIGMNQDDIDKLFRIDVDPKTIGSSDEKGSGLGLIICKDLVQNLGGKIWVKSEINKGSRFYFSVPR